MPSSRRDALRTLPALAATALAGCSGLGSDAFGDDGLGTLTAWSVRAERPTPGPRVAGGPLLVGSRSPFEDAPLVAAHDPETGTREWRVRGSDGRGSPVGADDELAYAVTAAGEAVAVDHQSGEVPWRTAVGSGDVARPGVVGLAPVPLAAAGRVLVPLSRTDGETADRLTGIDRATGEQVYRHALPASLAGSPATVDGGTAAVAPLVDGTLRRVDPDGATAWEVDLGAPLSDATAAAGTVYVGSATEELVAVDTATGEVRWRGRLSNTVFTAPRVVEGTVYVGAADYYLYAFAAADGTRRWRSETVNAVTDGPLSVEERLVTRVGGQLRRRPPVGTVPRSPARLVVHRTDGTQVGSFDAAEFVDGDDVRWLAAAGDAAYVGQRSHLIRLAGGGVRGA